MKSKEEKIVKELEIELEKTEKDLINLKYCAINL